MKDIFTTDQVRALAETFETLMSEVDARIAAALAAQPPSVHHCGVFRDGQRYAGGALVTRSGSLWLAKRDTSSAPGTDAASWLLVAKGNGHANNGHDAEPRKRISTAVRQ